MDLLRDITITKLIPLDPADKSTFLPLDPVTHGTPVLIPGVQSPASDPDTGIVSDPTHPLAFYRLWPPQGNILSALKDLGNDTVRFEF